MAARVSGNLSVGSLILYGRQGSLDSNHQGIMKHSKEKFMSKTNTKFTGPSRTGSKRRLSSGAGTRGVCLNRRLVRMFRSRNRYQHPQDLGGVGFGAVEEASPTWVGLPSREKVRALPRLVFWYRVRGRVMGIMIGNRKAIALRPQKRYKSLPVTIRVMADSKVLISSGKLQQAGTRSGCRL